jgi:uncharacterized membrane protein YdfJ with MMPL/SSD domain
VNLAILAVALAVAIGAPDHVGVGSLALNEGSAQDRESEPDLVIATTGAEPVQSRTYGVALQAISLQVRTDTEVASVRRGPISANGRSTALGVKLRPGSGVEHQRAIERIEDSIDPGPLRVAFGGTVATGLDARHQLSHDLWQLELLAVPLVVLILIVALGVRLAAASALCAGTAIAGALAALRVVDGFADLSLLGIAPAAVVGLAVGIEAPAMLAARYRDEAYMSSPEEALPRALEGGAGLALPFVLATTAATTGLLVIPLDQGPSIVFACAIAAAVAVASSLVAVSAVLGLELRSRPEAAEPSGTARMAEAARAAAGLLAGSRARASLAAVVAAVAMVVAAASMLNADSRPLSALDLPAGSPARQAAKVLSPSRVEPAGGDSRELVADPASSNGREDSLFPKLILAAAVSAGALALVFAIGFRSARLVPMAVVTLLPAAAACGLCVLVFQDGHLAEVIGGALPGALETGAVASLLAAGVAVSAIRGIAAVDAVREERLLGLDPVPSAETASALTVPAATTASLVAIAMAGVLVGSELAPAREFGLAVAAGLLLDLVLLRVPAIAALARWGFSSHPVTDGAGGLSEAVDG